MVTKKQLQEVNTLEELQDLGIGNVFSEVGYRGGGIGFYSGDVSEHFDVPEYYLPHKFGAGCNYLGGGVRGSVFASNFDKNIQGEERELLEELANACVRVYIDLENESGLNNEVDEDGDTNWDALATKGARNSGVRSAY